MKCHACGGELRDTAKFCGFCGADQSKRPEELNTCTHCGQEIPAGAHFCGKCGSNQAEIPVIEENKVYTPVMTCEEDTQEIPTSLPEEADTADLLPLVTEDDTAEVIEEAAMEEAPAQETATEKTHEAEAICTDSAVVVDIPNPEPAPQTPPTPAPVAQPAPQVPPTPVQQPQQRKSYQPQQPYPQQNPYQHQNPYQQQSYQQPNYQNPYQPNYQRNPYQPAYQPQQNIQVNVSNPMPQRPVAPMFTQAPAYQLPCERGLLKMLLLGILTGGIYPLVIYSRISMEINMAASRYDGQRTMHFLWMCFLAPLTLMIYPFVWIHNLCNRMGGELHRRQINYRFSAASYWLWTLVYGMVGGMVTGIVAYVLFTIVQLQQIMVLLICSALMLASMVGPLVFIHKMMKAMNLINADYNRRG